MVYISFHVYFYILYCFLLYFVDHIQHAALDGSDIQTINSKHIKHPFSLVVHSDFVYVTDWRLDAVFRVHKLKGGDGEIVTKVEDSNRLYGVKVYSKVEQVGCFTYSYFEKQTEFERGTLLTVYCFWVAYFGRPSLHGRTTRMRKILFCRFNWI